jgi:hypothetical protein
MLPLPVFCHLLNVRSGNRLPQQPWLGFDTKFSITIFPTGGLAVLYRYRTWQTGNCKTFLLGLCSRCQSFHSVCLARSSPHLSLPTNAFIAPRSTIQGITIHPTNFISHPQDKASPLAMQSRLSPPLWPSHSLVAKACLHPPPWPSRSPVTGKANPETQLQQLSLSQT